MTALSSDLPCADPKDDLFGHAPFAKRLADSICLYPGRDGLVLALYGPWGSGKSTVLGFIQYFLEKRPEAERPVIVTFNPWWFSGQENLARAFLGQLGTVLPQKSEKFRKLGDLIGKFSEGIGGLADLSGAGHGIGKAVGGLLAQVLKRKPKDVPALKNEIVKILRDADKRILIVIDDIDRLVPEETRQLFTVIKALADFPNVTYLLAFDREVAIDAIEKQTGLPGERYLEKIIQVPFELPPVDRVSLQTALFKRLDEVLIGTPDGLFNQTRWANVYHDGIDALVKVPRDVVRFTNTLSVTYQSVVGEVNPVDFIAIEAIRVFLPRLYDVMRANPAQFAGAHSQDSYSGESHKAQKAFQNRWLQDVPEPLQNSTLSLMERLFPRFKKITYGWDWFSKWRKELLVCCPECFPIYFSLSLPSDAVRRSEIEALIALTATPHAFGDALVQATKEKRPDGISKARALLERLMDYVETDIPGERIEAVVNVLLDIGDDLILVNDEQGALDFGNESRVVRVVYHLLKRVDQSNRLPTLKGAFEHGRGVGVQGYLVGTLMDEVAKHGDDVLMDSTSVDELKDAWLKHMRARTMADDLLSYPRLARLLAEWREWGSSVDVRAWCERVTKTDEGLLSFLSKFSSQTRSWGEGDRLARIQLRLPPKSLEPYIDIEGCAKRLVAFEQAAPLPEAAAQFMVEFRMIKEGKNSDALNVFGN
ncbi:MAG: AAA family ATPase [Alphaproteobacteria bacterium]|nr:AAA family ATPase [Alphaproteobacteria bacterium]